MNEDDKKLIVHDLNIRIGANGDYSNALEVKEELVQKLESLQKSLNEVNNEVPTKLSSAIKKAERNSKQIEDLKIRSESFNKKFEEFLERTLPLRDELDTRFAAIRKLEVAVNYVKTFEIIEDISIQMKQCSDDEQAVNLYGQLKELCIQYKKGHRGTYVKEYTHYWHNILKEKFSKQYEDLLKVLKWPFVSSSENSPPSKEIITKFHNLTKYLFLIEEPASLDPVSGEFNQEQNTCLPMKILLRPLKKRFTFHFMGTRQTARISRPEWFLTQTLTWIKDHQTFVANHVQMVAEKLHLKHVQVVDQFNAGLISFAAERLHMVLGLYHTQGAKGEIVDVDAAFAHAVDETLGFHRELVVITGKDEDGVLSVLTKAETFVRWLAVEKKYALMKMDEMLGSESWGEAVGEGVSSAVGSVQWVPRAADWFIALLKTIEDRYAVLPQPGHRLQFVELQLELVEEWRVRLTQLLGAASGEPTPLAAVLNAAHHTRAVLLQWAHSLHYLQLHYYRRQFQQFTQRQHRDSSVVTDHTPDADDPSEENDNEETLSLNEVEVSAKEMALKEVTKRNSIVMDLNNSGAACLNVSVKDRTEDEGEAGIFGEAPSLLAHLRDAGLAAMAEHILLEFKATLRDYKKQKWHAMIVVEQRALTVSPALCGPLGELCARLGKCSARLAPPLAAALRARLAADLDNYIFQEVVLQSWFNTGGTVQFTHDVKRNMVPAFASPNKSALQVNLLPKLSESCLLLNMDSDDARRLRSVLVRQQAIATRILATIGVRYLNENDALRILSQRTDLNIDTSAASAVLDLF